MGGGKTAPDERSAAIPAPPGASPQSGAEAPVAEPNWEAVLARAQLTPAVRAAIAGLMGEVAQLRDELRRARARIGHLEHLADEDTLTPIANRRAFVRELARMISFAKRYKTPASVIFFDVNGLKKINDAHGHMAGDAALVHVARVLADNIRDSDFVGRLAGDEFGVILVQADQEQAEIKAETLAAAVRDTPVEFRGSRFAMAVSYGVHCFRKGEDAVGALDAADRAMYRQKRAAG